MWLSFDSIINSFGSQLVSWIGGIINHYILETSILHYRIATYIPSDSCVLFTTLSNFHRHLHRINHSRNEIFALTLRIKPCAYCVTCFSDEHQSCQYFNHCDNLILIHIFLKRIATAVKFLFTRAALRIIILSERARYVLRRTTPNILNLILFVSISYYVLVSFTITLLLLLYLVLYLLLILCTNLLLYLSIVIYLKVE